MAREDDIRRIVAGGRAKGLHDDQIRALVARYDARMAPASTPLPAAATAGMMAQSTIAGDPSPSPDGGFSKLQWKPEHAALGAQINSAEMMAAPLVPNVMRVAKAIPGAAGRAVTFAANALDKPFISGAIGAAEGARQGGARGALYGGVGGVATGTVLGRGLRAIGLRLAPPPSVNAGGRLAPRSTPSVNESLDEALTAMRAPQSATIAPSHPSGGGFTAPPPSANRGGRLVQRSTPSVNESLLQGLNSTRSPVVVQPSLMTPGRARSVTLPEQPPGPSVTMSPRAQAAAAGRTPREGVDVEQLYRALARKPILSPQEQQVFEQLKQVVTARASHVGRSFASGGKSGIP